MTTTKFAASISWHHPSRLVSISLASNKSQDRDLHQNYRTQRDQSAVREKRQNSRKRAWISESSAKKRSSARSDLETTHTRLTSLSVFPDSRAINIPPPLYGRTRDARMRESRISLMAFCVALQPVILSFSVACVYRLHVYPVGCCCCRCMWPGWYSSSRNGTRYLGGVTERLGCTYVYICNRSTSWLIRRFIDPSRR